MPTIKNMSMPRRASIDMMRCVGVGERTSETLGDTEVGSAAGEAVEDICGCCRWRRGITSLSGTGVGKCERLLKSERNVWMLDSGVGHPHLPLHPPPRPVTPLQA